MTNSKSLIPSVASLWRTPAVNRFRSDMDELFESFFLGKFGVMDTEIFNDMQSHKSEFPKINVSETDSSYVVDIAIAGFNKDDVSLKLRKHALDISSGKKEEEKVEEKNYLRREISLRSFNRTIGFPKPITDEATASYADGIIKVEIKKEDIKERFEGINIDIN